MVDNQELPKLMSVAETATALRVSDETVHNMIKSGSLAAIRVGAKVLRIREADVVSIISGKGVAK